MGNAGTAQASARGPCWSRTRHTCPSTRQRTAHEPSPGVRDENGRVPRIVIIGGGPAGYEAALVAAQLGATVTVVEADGAGGACVLSDCVPSKTFIASSDVVTAFHHGGNLGVRVTAADAVVLDAAAVHARGQRLALAP